MAAMNEVAALLMEHLTHFEVKMRIDSEEERMAIFGIDALICEEKSL